MKRTLIFLLIIALSCGILSSCGDSDLPEGMQLIRGGEEYGYYFYAPEEWTNSSVGSIARAHVSAIDTSSVSFHELAIPEGSIDDYFLEDMQKLPYDEEPIIEDGVDVIFGGVSGARKFVYTFKHSNVEFKGMQIYVKRHDSLYCFTYQSTLQLVDGEKSYYDFYYPKVQEMIDAFKFVDKVQNAENAPQDPDGDGYYLASDKDICGFELYLPLDYELRSSSGMVSANINGENGPVANLSLSKATGTGVSITDYIKTRQEQLSTVFDNLTSIRIIVRVTETSALEQTFEGVEIVTDTDLKLGDLPSIAAYEYTYEYNGTTYHTLQVYGANSFNGYVFTYTAREADFESNLDEISLILGKVVF